MSAFKIRYALSEIERNMAELAPYRKPELFNEFLLKGYTAITLSSVSKARFSQLLEAKLCLGTLITLYDDFADRPEKSNPQLLEGLYQLNFENCHRIESLNRLSCREFDFAKSLFMKMKKNLDRLPHYCHLSEILNFDLMQFYNANRFSSLLMANPHINNQMENRLYAHHNMGMVIVAMMDLMAIEEIEFSELSAMREIFLMGQRLGRTFNVLTTRKREALDGDITGELATCQNDQEIELAERKLRQEICGLRDKMREFDSRITTFSVTTYLEGLAEVQTLHEKMEGII